MAGLALVLAGCDSGGSDPSGPNEVLGSGMVLSLASMFVPSDDLFYAFQPSSFALFDENDQPVGGGVTERVRLYDAGPEGDQEPGVGIDQAPRQSGADTGSSGEGSILRGNGSDGEVSSPSPNNIICVTIMLSSQ